MAVPGVADSVFIQQYAIVKRNAEWGWMISSLGPGDTTAKMIYKAFDKSFIESDQCIYW